MNRHKMVNRRFSINDHLEDIVYLMALTTPNQLTGIKLNRVCLGLIVAKGKRNLLHCPERGMHLA